MDRNNDIAEIFSKKSFAPETFNAIESICSPYSKKLKFSAFEYARVYDDGTACILYSDNSIANYVITNKLHISAHVPEQIITTEFWFIPDSSCAYNKVTQEISSISSSSSSSFANYIRRYSGYYEMYCFWRKEEQGLALNLFFNMKESLEQFCHYFSDTAKDLILAANKDRFKLTESMLPNFQGLGSEKNIASVNLLFYLEKTRNELVKLNHYIYPKLSNQELKCISFLLEGRSIANIANSLTLSERTIEMHMNSIKLKLNCQKKSDVISTLVNLASSISNR